MSPDPGIIAGYRRALARTGQQVTFIRANGFTPHVAEFSATVMARVMSYTPDSSVVGRTDFSANKLGAITQGDRKIIVLEADLADAHFPLPLRKHDKAVVNGETLDILQVDPNTREKGGAIELVAAGV